MKFIELKMSIVQSPEGEMIPGNGEMVTVAASKIDTVNRAIDGSGGAVITLSSRAVIGTDESYDSVVYRLGAMRVPEGI